MGYAKENVETYLELFDEVSADVTGIHYLKEKLGEYLPEETAAEYGTDHVKCGGRQKNANLI